MTCEGYPKPLTIFSPGETIHRFFAMETVHQLKEAGYSKHQQRCVLLDLSDKQQQPNAQAFCQELCVEGHKCIGKLESIYAKNN